MKLSTHAGTGELAENKLKTVRTGGWAMVRRLAGESGPETERREKICDTGSRQNEWD